MNANTVKASNPQEQFALWLAQNQPDVFQALVAQAHRRGQLNGITDWLTSVGSTLGSAVKSVGSFVSSPAGLATIGTLGTVYLQSQAQRDALRLQTQQLQAGYPPQPIYSSGTDAYYRDPATGQSYPMTSQLANQLKPPMNWIPIAIAGSAVIVIMFMLSGRAS